MDEATRSLLRRLHELSATVRPQSLEVEMGEMCRHSLFDRILDGEQVTQERVDAASHAFITFTQRFMPPDLVNAFISNACSMGLQPAVDEVDLVPGFTDDESLAGADAAQRHASEMRKFSRQEVLSCLAWNQAEPEVPVAIAHFIGLLRSYTEVLCEMVSRGSESAGLKFDRFASQWASRNLLKFTNVALWVVGHGQGEGFTVDQALINEAMDLLNHSASFTWHIQKDGRAGACPAERIHCPAQALIQKLVVNQGTLLQVIRFVRDEAHGQPPSSELSASLELVRRFAAREEARVRAQKSVSG